jgi:hypothetical protein
MERGFAPLSWFERDFAAGNPRWRHTPRFTRSACCAVTCGERQRALLAYRAGEVDLMFVGGKWYLAVVCDMPEPEKIGIEDVLGVDFGVVNLAFDSEGGRTPGRMLRRFASWRRG